MITGIVLVTCVVVLCNAAFEGEDCTAGGVAGTCALLPKCPSAIEAIKRRERPVNCGFDGATPIVCCVNNAVPTAGKVTTQQPPTPITTQKTSTTTMYIPETPIYVDADRAGDCEPLSASLTTAKTGQKAFDKCIDYQRQYVYPCERSVSLIADVGDMSTVNHCHHNADELIVGGNDTAAYEFPHMVMLGYGEEQSISWLCGGSIISENYVLTAGHCISTRLGDVRFLLVGALTRSDANDPANIYKVKRIIKHPDYESPSKYNDITLLETEKRIALSQFVVPACLHVGDPVNDTKVLATGWGLTEYKGSLAEVMQKVILEKFSTQECAVKYPKHRNMMRGFDPESQTCYGDRTQKSDTCQGDSGGPIQIKSKKIHCMYTVVGVTSFGRACGFPAQPAIYTRVAHFVPWIESIVWP